MSRAFHCDALDTPHAYILTKIKLGQKWGQKTEKSGQNSPFEALADEMWAQYIQASSFWAKMGPFGGPRSAEEVS